MTYEITPDKDKIYQVLGNVNLQKEYNALRERNPSKGKRFGTEAEALKALEEITSDIRDYFMIKRIFGSPGFRVL